MKLNFTEKANFIWQVADEMLLEFVNLKLDLYKKLTEPKINAMIKRQWFDGYMQGLGG